MNNHNNVQCNCWSVNSSKKNQKNLNHFKYVTRRILNGLTLRWEVTFGIAVYIVVLLFSDGMWLLFRLDVSAAVNFDLKK